MVGLTEQVIVCSQMSEVFDCQWFASAKWFSPLANLKRTDKINSLARCLAGVVHVPSPGPDLGRSNKQASERIRTSERVNE